MSTTKPTAMIRLAISLSACRLNQGTFAPLGMHLWLWPYLVNPPLHFAAHARELAPDVEVRVLLPGETLELGVPARHAALAGDGGPRAEPAPGDAGPA